MQNGGGAISKVTPVPFSPTRISVKDFGPIREADIDLKRVTILMGTDNAGRSYFTLLMPVLEQLARDWRYMQAHMKPPKYTLEDFELHLNIMLYDKHLRYGLGAIGPYLLSGTLKEGWWLFFSRPIRW